MNSITELNAPRVEKRRKMTGGRTVVGYTPNMADRCGVTRISLSLDKAMFRALLERAVDDRVSVAEVVRNIVSEALRE